MKVLIFLLYSTTPDSRWLYQFGDLQFDNIALQKYGTLTNSSRVIYYSLDLLELLNGTKESEYLRYWINNKSSLPYKSGSSDTIVNEMLYNDQLQVNSSYENISTIYNFENAGLILSRTSWNYSEDNIFWGLSYMDINKNSQTLDHLQKSGLAYQIMRGDDFVTKKLIGYGGASSEGRAHNTVLVQNQYNNYSGAGYVYTDGGIVLNQFVARPNFTYVVLDGSKAYSMDINQFASSTAKNVTRKFLHIKPDIFLVLDYVATNDSESPTGKSKKAVSIRFENQPNITGNEIFSYEGDSHIYVDFLLPIDYNITLINESEYYSSLDGQGLEYNAPIEHRKWHILSESISNTNSTTFMHIIQIGNSTFIKKNISLLNDTNAYGIFMNGTIVMLSKSLLKVDSVQYSISGSGLTNHIIADLIQNKTYYIYQNGLLFNQINSSSEGIINFYTSLTGNNIYIISNQTLQYTPIVPKNLINYTKGNNSNFILYNKSYLSEPGKGECVYDAIYGSNICKVADKTEFNSTEIASTIRPVYSRWQIENSDGSKYFLIKDGETPSGSGKGHTVIYHSSNNSIYKIITEVNSQETREFRWDYSGSKPNIMYYVAGCLFYNYNISSGVSTIVRNFSIDFPSCGRILNDVEGDSSGDSRYWAFMVEDSYSGGTYPMRAIITYDKTTNSILGTINYSSYISMNGTSSKLPTPNMVDISPLGTKVVLLNGRSWGARYYLSNWTYYGNNTYYVNITTAGNTLSLVKDNETNIFTGGYSTNLSFLESNINSSGKYFLWRNSSQYQLFIRTFDDSNPNTKNISAEYGQRPTDLNTSFDGPHAFDFNFSNPVRVCNDETHGGWAFDYDGSEVYVCQINNGNWINAEADTIAYTNIQTGETNTIIYHADVGWDVGGWHFGRFYNQSIRGWVYGTSYSNYNTSNSWNRNQAFMLELKNYSEHPRVWRITDTHNNYPSNSGYKREAYSPITRDGKYIYWGADWPSGDGTVDTYRVELPNNWWVELSGSQPHQVNYNTSMFWMNSTTNFTQYNNTQLLNLSNVSFVNSFGKILFQQIISISKSIDLTNKILIENKKITFDSTDVNEFNKTKKIVFKNITYAHPIIKKNNATCSTCTNITYNQTTKEYEFID